MKIESFQDKYEGHKEKKNKESRNRREEENVRETVDNKKGGSVFHMQ